MSTRNMVRLGIAAASTFLAAAVLPATGSAATTIGSDLSSAPSPSAINCFAGGGCTLINQTISAGTQAAGGATSPIDGVVVRWRIRTGSGTSNTAPRIVRQVTPTTFIGVGTGTTVVPNLEGVTTYETRLPIKAGDFFGIDQEAASRNRASVPGSTYGLWVNPDLADNGAPQTVTDGAFEILINADVEADADGDGFGDETQDGCPADATAQVAPCPVDPPPNTVITKAPKKKTKKAKVKVQFASTESGSTYECRVDSKPFAPCTSPATFRVKKGKHTISIRAIDQAGNVDETPAEVKVKRVKKKTKK